MTVRMVRAGRYEVRADDQVVGYVTGDYVIGFRAVATDSSMLTTQFSNPFEAARALEERHEASARHAGGAS